MEISTTLKVALSLLITYFVAVWIIYYLAGTLNQTAQIPGDVWQSITTVIKIAGIGIVLFIILAVLKETGFFGGKKTE